MITWEQVKSHEKYVKSTPDQRKAIRQEWIDSIAGQAKTEDERKQVAEKLSRETEKDLWLTDEEREHYLEKVPYETESTADVIGATDYVMAAHGDVSGLEKKPKQKLEWDTFAGYYDPIDLTVDIATGGITHLLRGGVEYTGRTLLKSVFDDMVAGMAAGAGMEVTAKVTGSEGAAMAGGLAGPATLTAIRRLGAETIKRAIQRNATPQQIYELTKTILDDDEAAKAMAAYADRVGQAKKALPAPPGEMAGGQMLGTAYHPPEEVERIKEFKALADHLKAGGTTEEFYASKLAFERQKGLRMFQKAQTEELSELDEAIKKFEMRGKPVEEEMLLGGRTVSSELIWPSPMTNAISTHAGVIKGLTDANGGATYNLIKGDLAGTKSFAVAVYPEFSVKIPRKVTSKEIAKYLQSYSKYLDDPRVSAGTWVDDDGITWLDISVTPKNKWHAVALGKKYNQQTIYDLSKVGQDNAVIPIGGTGARAVNPELAKLAWLRTGQGVGGGRVKAGAAPHAITPVHQRLNDLDKIEQEEFVGLVRYMREDGLREIDPNNPKHYTDISGEARKGRLAGFPEDTPKRVHYYFEGGAEESQVAALPYKYRCKIPKSKLYDVKTDPLNLKVRAKPEGMAQADMNLAESMMRDAGYWGYAVPEGRFPSTVVMFEQMPVDQIPSGTFRDGLARVEAAARQRIKGRKGALYAGLPVEDFYDYAVIGAVKIARGAHNFTTYANRMIQEFGERMQDMDLAKLYERSKFYISNHIKATRGEMPSTKELLKLYREGKWHREWYNYTREELEKLFGPDAEMFTRFLAATSANTQVDANLTLALKAYDMWKTGITDYATWRNEFLEEHMGNLWRAVKGEPLNGMKVGNFYKNLMGDEDAVTVDSWMYRLWGFKANAPSPRQYEYINRYITKLAKQTGCKPREMQAALWVAYKLREGVADRWTVQPFETLLKDRLRVDPNLKTKFEQWGKEVGWVFDEIPFGKHADADTSFRKWFGRSKIVTEDGAPLKVYHATTADFDTFLKTSDFGYHFGNADQAQDVIERATYKQNPHMVIESGQHLSGVFYKSGLMKGYPKGAKVIPAYLHIENPLRLHDGGAWTPNVVLKQLNDLGISDATELQLRDWASDEAVRLYALEKGLDLNQIKNKTFDQVAEELNWGAVEMHNAYNRIRDLRARKEYEFVRTEIENAGYDGVIYRNEFEGAGGYFTGGRQDSYIAFHENQIKSVFSKKFDPTDARFQEGFIRSEVVAAIARAMIGGAIGATQGDTIEDRIKNALIGAGIGAAASPKMIRALAKSTRAMIKGHNIEPRYKQPARALDQTVIPHNIEQGDVIPIEHLMEHPEVRHFVEPHGDIIDLTDGISETHGGLLSRVKEYRDKYFLKVTDNDLKDWRRLWNTPQWLARKYENFKGIFDRQRLRERHSTYMRRMLIAGGNVEAGEAPGISKLLKLGNAEYDVVARRLIEGDKAGKVFDPTELTQMGFSPEMVEAYGETRATLDWVLNDIWKRADASGADKLEIQKYREEIGRIIGYIPHQRYGKKWIAAIDQDTGETLWSTAYDSLTGRKGRKIYDFIKEKYPNARIESGVQKNVPEEVFFNVSPEALDAFMDAALTGMKADEQLRKSFFAAASNVLKERGFFRHARTRAGTPGYRAGLEGPEGMAEFSPKTLKSVLVDYLSGYSGWATKMEAAQDMSKILQKNIDITTQPNLWDYGWHYIKDMLENADRTDRLVGRIRTAFFCKYLGFNIKSAALNSTQNVVMAAPALAKEGVKMPEFKIAKAMKDLAFHYAGKDALAPDEKAALQYALLQGELDAKYLQELHGLSEGRVPRTLQRTIEYSGWLFGLTEKTGRAATYLTAFRHFKDSMEPAAAAKKAMEVVEDAWIVYGKSNLPEWARGSKTGKLLRIPFTFRSYTHGYLQFLGNLMKHDVKQLKQGKFSASSLRSLAWIGALGGVSGIPFIDEATALYQKATGKDPKTEVKKMIEQATDSEALANMVMYGLPGAGIPGVVPGVSLSGSLSIEIPHDVDDILGVATDPFVQIAKSAYAVSKGNYYRALEQAPFMPQFISNVMSGHRLATEGQTTQSGYPVKRLDDQGNPVQVQLNKLEMLERFLGFQPVKMAEGWRQFQAKKGHDQFWLVKKQRLENLWLHSMRKGDYDKADKLVDKMVDLNGKLPESIAPISAATLRDKLYGELSAREVAGMKEVR